MLSCLPPLKDPRILAGREDNAAVYRLREDQAVIQTVDYITPVVDDPYQFGMIAAANAMSDIYAMGGTPVMALNLVGFPNQSLPLSILEDILRGGADKAAEAGVSIAGGHSVTDHAPKYGMVVTGFVDPRRMVTKRGVREGDALILTKPLGIGAVTTGIDRRLVNGELVEKVVQIMTTLNRRAAEIMMQVGVNACTDVTGFGLLGHLREILTAGRVGARIAAFRVPVIPEAVELIQAGAVAAGTHNNYRYLRDLVRWDDSLSREMKLLLCDPQTSGGLLITVPRERKEQLLAALREDPEVPAVAEIGEVVKGPGEIYVVG
ncbi:selenide, water dikinase SelD [Desulfotomaculum copahuensis]|uniref:Selenide, water dikinase SelD n=1 Tax=Desulfotomaculum copahuensis TaxID=1838280 RepID=A0A1B7LCS3_9FIRM|nr:selenide, water dikinase SelD [Desulfotomaculum copahuensis]